MANNPITSVEQDIVLPNNTLSSISIERNISHHVLYGGNPITSVGYDIVLPNNTLSGISIERNIRHHVLYGGNFKTTNYPIRTRDREMKNWFNKRQQTHSQIIELYNFKDKNIVIAKIEVNGDKRAHYVSLTTMCDDNMRWRLQNGLYFMDRCDKYSAKDKSWYDQFKHTLEEPITCIVTPFLQRQF